ncbi:MAG TPA: neprosin family prolyl endopeptidase [Thermoanaerobaculia bacterium]|nr:neprosin family prolyl endopeptidase [Thermoanaerobaculia bacterium]
MKLLTPFLVLSLLVRCASTGTTVTREALGPYDCVDAAASLASPPPRDVLDLGVIRGDSREVRKMRPRKALIGIEACGGGQVPVSRTPAKNNVAKGNPLFRPNELTVDDFFRGNARTEKKPWDRVYIIPPGPDREPHKVPPDPPGCNGISWFGSCYYYGPAAFHVTADGGGMTMRIQKPAFSGDGHSLDEIAVQGGSGNGNIIELGWNVSPFQYAGDSNPHLFVFHWIDDKPTCYDGCGWVQYSKTYFPGMSLSALIGKSVYVGYVIYNGNWWAWFDNQWLGYFPGSEWSGTYTKSNLIQWFGEVATNNGTPPKVQMGNGLFPSNASAAVNRTLCDVDAAAWVCWVRDKQSLGPTYPPYYDINRTGFGETRYGGPGT